MEKNENKIVDVIATSDMHSHFLNGDYGSNIYRAGTYVNEARKNNENVILLDSGEVWRDHLQHFITPL